MEPTLFPHMNQLLRRRSVLQRRLAHAQGAPADVRSPKLDGMPRGASAHPDAQAALGYLDAVLREYCETERELADLRARIEPGILALPPGPHKLVLRLRYLEWHTISDVSKGCGYDRRYIYRLLTQAEQKLNKG